MQGKNQRMMAVLFLGLAAGCGGVEPDPEVVEAEGGLIGGALVPANQATPTVLIYTQGGFCTASRVGPRHLLTAAHCIESILPGNGRDISISASRNYHNAVWQQRKIDFIGVDPVYLLQCGLLACNNESPTVPPHGADIAIIRLNSNLPAAWPTATIDRRPVSLGTWVTMFGYGCEQNLSSPSPTRMKAMTTQTISPSQVNTPSVLVTNAEMPVFSANHLVTAGRGLNAAQASLCPGDSGGPLYRGGIGGTRVVAVNASYFFQDNSGVSRTNLHARTSAASFATVLALFPELNILK